MLSAFNEFSIHISSVSGQVLCTPGSAQLVGKQFYGFPLWILQQTQLFELSTALALVANFPRL